MRHVKRLVRGWGVALIIIFVGASIAVGADWWESKQANTPTDRISRTPSSIPGQIKAAGRTNWEDGYIEVMAGATADQKNTVNQAHAYAVALKTARHLAYEKMAETVGGINIYSDATYDRELMQDANLRTLVQAMIRGARVLQERKTQFSDGSIWAEVTLGMKLFGEDGLMQPTSNWQARHRQTLAETEGSGSSQSAAEHTAEPGKIDAVYTGLIIDARDLPAVPAMLPKIVSSSRKILYGTQKIDRDYLVKMGLMGYEDSLQEAGNGDRVGENPLIVKAVAVQGANHTDFVVSDQDAARIIQAAKVKNFLNECRVVAVLN